MADSNVVKSDSSDSSDSSSSAASATQSKNVTVPISLSSPHSSATSEHSLPVESNHNGIESSSGSPSLPSSSSSSPTPRNELFDSSRSFLASPRINKKPTYMYSEVQMRIPDHHTGNNSNNNVGSNAFQQVRKRITNEERRSNISTHRLLPFEKKQLFLKTQSLKDMSDYNTVTITPCPTMQWDAARKAYRFSKRNATRILNIPPIGSPRISGTGAITSTSTTNTVSDLPSTKRRSSKLIISKLSESDKSISCLALKKDLQSGGVVAIESTVIAEPTQDQGHKVEPQDLEEIEALAPIQPLSPSRLSNRLSTRPAVRVGSKRFATPVVKKVSWWQKVFPNFMSKPLSPVKMSRETIRVASMQLQPFQVNSPKSTPSLLSNQESGSSKSKKVSTFLKKSKAKPEKPEYRKSYMVIELDNNNSEVLQGSVIYGKITTHMIAPLEVKGLWLNIEGCDCCYWVDNRPYSYSKHFLDEVLLVNQTTQVANGQSEFTFRYKIPADSPLSCRIGTLMEFKRGISYRLTAYFKGTNGKPKGPQALKFFSVVTYIPQYIPSPPLEHNLNTNKINMKISLEPDVTIGGSARIALHLTNSTKWRTIDSISIHFIEKHKQQIPEDNKIAPRKARYELYQIIQNTNSTQPPYTYTDTYSIPMEEGRTWPSIETPNKLVRIYHRVLVVVNYWTNKPQNTASKIKNSTKIKLPLKVLPKLRQLSPTSNATPLPPEQNNQILSIQQFPGRPCVGDFAKDVLFIVPPVYKIQ